MVPAAPGKIPLLSYGSARQLSIAFHKNRRRFVIMELIKLVVPVFVPAIFSLYFDLFDGLIQTYVFVFLTSLFMKETME